jgi:hypothetical protein
MIGTRSRHGGEGARRRFVREREEAISSLLEGRPMAGRTLQVEVRERGGRRGGGTPDISILWREEVPMAARLGASVLVRRGAEPRARAAIEQAARAEGLALQTMGERRLWTLLGVPQ